MLAFSRGIIFWDSVICRIFGVQQNIRLLPIVKIWVSVVLYYRSETAVMAVIVAVWIVLFAFLIGLPPSGEDNIPEVVIGVDAETGIGFSGMVARWL